MGSEFSFYNYVDGAGNDVIRAWLETLPTKPRQRFKTWLLHLEGTPHGNWTRPYVETLDGYCAGLFEIRVSLGKQYRLLGTHMGKTPTLLHGFIKPGKKVRREECDRAFKHLADVSSDPEKHRVEHSYD